MCTYYKRNDKVLASALTRHQVASELTGVPFQDRSSSFIHASLPTTAGARQSLASIILRVDYFPRYLMYVHLALCYGSA